jgi:hypothetical protein
MLRGGYTMSSNTATVSFKLTPEYYALLRAMAGAQGKTVSMYVREVLCEALDMKGQVDRLTAMYADPEDLHRKF